MANLLDIKRRIRSVKNTQQLTKAMKMISAVKLRRSQEHILATRPYAVELAKVTAKLAQGARAAALDAEPEVLDAGEGGPEAAGVHPLLEVRPENRVLLVVVSGDRGLAGSFNASVLRLAQKETSRWETVELLLLGKKGADFYGRRSIPIRKAFRDLFTRVTYEQAKAIAEDIAAAYSAGEYDAVYVIYNQFKSIASQELTEERLLPIPVAEAEGAAGGEHGEDAEREVGTDYLYEPSPDAILARILPRYVTFQVYRALLESQAAEHAARMTAMDSATNNAGEIIDKLTLNYNRARQAAITKELIEVVSGANALEG